MLASRCPVCGGSSVLYRRLCACCGAARVAPETPEAQRECLEELRRALAAAEAGGDDPMTTSRAQDRLLRGGYLPDDCELLLVEAEWCMRAMSGAGDFSCGAGARYQACVSKFERLRLTANAATAASAGVTTRRRRLLWRIASGAPLGPAPQLLNSPATIVCVRWFRSLRGPDAALPPHPASGKIPG